MTRAVRLILAALAIALTPAQVASAATRHTTTTAAPVPAAPAGAPPVPRGWILVDADTGAVLDAGHEHEPQRVASVFKVLTAVTMVENTDVTADVPVSARAEGMPARKINLKAGQVWHGLDLLHCLLLISANDAAVALAEHAAGSLEGFGGMLDATAARLGMADNPVLRDPAGLDDEFSVDGGNLISPRDLAIATRAFLAYPQLVDIVAKPDYRFAGGDGNQHRLLNHNTLLKSYPGAIGIKTGYTKRAGHSLIGAARRDGRTMIAIAVGAADPNRSVAALLDKGFATPAAAEGEFDHLPAVRLGSARDPVTKAVPRARPVSTPSETARASAGSGGASLSRDVLLAVALLLLGGTPALLILARRSRARSQPLRP
jgi:D-alanyl-D-alanine carboxypeptidase (penicillin-binding protein 5/6)